LHCSVSEWFSVALLPSKLNSVVGVKMNNITARGVDPAAAGAALPSVHAAVVPTTVLPAKAGTTFSHRSDDG
jgi:hypothetical protein